MATSSRKKLRDIRRFDSPRSSQTVEAEESKMHHTSRKRLEEQNARKGLEDAAESLLSKSTFRKGLEKQECNTRKGQDKEARFEEPEADEDRKDATGLEIEDANPTPKGSELDIDEVSEDEAKKSLLKNPLPKARPGTNIVSDDYIPEGRLFRAHTTRGEGTTQATFRLPLAVRAVMRIASTRDGARADERFLSAQVNWGIAIPVHKDKNNYGETWLIGLGEYTGGRLWIESHLGLHPPPTRGDYFDVCQK